MWLSLLLPKRLPNRGSKPRADRRPTTRFLPQVEALEDRWLPSQIGLNVTSLDDAGAGTLRSAIQTADAGSHSDKFTIDFAVNGTINLQSPLPDLDNNIAIQGPGSASLTIEEKPGLHFNYPIFNVGFGGEAYVPTLSISGMTLANSAAGIVNASNLTVANCAISNNHLPAGYGGAGIYNVEGKLTITGCDISDNSSGGGGGIYVNVGTVTISGSTISGNSAPNGGGIDVIYGTVNVSGSVISGNSATDGGGIDNYYYGSVTVSGSTVSGNSATEGGGILNQVGGTLKVSNNSTLSGNTAVDGGGLYNAGTATLEDSTLSGNTATEGGGIYNDTSGTLTVQGSTLTGNTAGDSGGGLYNLGTATVQDTTLSCNSAGGAGGGIFNGASGTLAIKDSVVCDNAAPLGADLDNLGSVILNDSTVCVSVGVP
jgi:hypothetical protein